MATVLVAGGGTGGHVFPGVAIARELLERTSCREVVFAGTSRGLESKIVPAEGFRLLTIRSAGIAGKSLTARLKGMSILPLSLWQSLAVIGKVRPKLVIGVGGYASGPLLVAALLRRVPALIHEQNFLPGTTNRWLAPYVSQVAITFPETARVLGGRGVVTGNPVRKEFTLVKPRPAGLAARSLLVFGGSQGSRAINRAMREALPELRQGAVPVKVRHQTGDADLEAVSSAYRAAGLDADVRAFISGMSQAFEEADLIVCRSGATTVAELTAAGRPAVLIPFAGATHDHQTYNARKLEDAGAAEVIPERELGGARLAATVTGLLESPDRLARMSQASRALGKPDAAARIADLCVDLMAGGRTS